MKKLSNVYYRWELAHTLTMAMAGFREAVTLLDAEGYVNDVPISGDLEKKLDRIEEYLPRFEKRLMTAIRGARENGRPQI